MDGIICLWDARGIRAEVIGNHKGSVSKVEVDGMLAISCGYDGCI
jgi:hypothetical protein